MIQFENVTHLFTPNWDQLRQHLRVLEETIPKAGGTMFNGWTVLGKNGKHTDGWVDGSAFMKSLPNGKLYFDTLAAAKAGYCPNNEHTKLTNASSPELGQLLTRAGELGLQPCRSRLIQLAPGAASTWHTDGIPAKTILRLHVVIESNPQAIFKTEQGETHLPAENIFLINVNFHHSVSNGGSTARTHLVTDVTDTKRISKLHQ